VQENNEVGGKFLECGRVLDFAVCLRVSGGGRGLRGLDFVEMGCGGAATAHVRDQSLGLGGVKSKPAPSSC
jgi:hypothetical protein